ncbi:MAG: MFS transporter [Spirochaetes bacterium]|nr:MFS transporter [Spirochaetota bacterium]
MKKSGNLMVLLFFVSFSQTAIFGCFNPIFSMYLKDYLNFSGRETGLVMGISVLASIISTLLIAGITARTGVGNRRMLIILHSMAAVTALVFSSQNTFVPVLIVYFMYNFAIGPTIGLINGLIFSSLGDKRKSYGRVRLGGTAGWITSGWFFGFFYMRLMHAGNTDYLSHAYYFAAFFSVLVIILVGLVPKPESEIITRRELSDKPGKLSLSWLADAKVRSVLIVFLLAGMIDVFYYFGAGPYLKHRGYAEADISPLLALGQVTEIIALFFLERIIKKIGYKRTILAGLLMQVMRYVLFSVGLPFHALPLIVLFHGPVIAFLYMTSTMMIDALVDDKIRNSVHQIISMLWIGLASFTGNIIAGFSMDLFTADGKDVNYTFFWIIPAGVTGAVIFLMLILVKREKVLSSIACASSVDADLGLTIREKY